ncbi:SPOC domain-containing protein [Neurospora intermedia]|uniref:Transcription factor BYE1 n=1 Tax=Neurospora intermedia TaxID=5142 RepID=A0ABR3D4K3_NEUIN
MSEPEPRRSVRATKGQHKALEQLDQIDIPKKRGKKAAKKAVPEPEEPEEEIIRCVCGATEQDEDSGEPWIACDMCGAWQHNICMGMSQYSEDLPKEYFCELCKPENHQELLNGMKNGERPWEARRKAFEEEKAEKRRRGNKKKSKRVSDHKEESAQVSQKPKPSPVPEPKKDAKSAAGQKRKTTEPVPEKEPKQKVRKVTETQAPSLPSYKAPDDIAGKISELPELRQGAAKLLSKSLVHSIGVAEKKGVSIPSEGVSATAERLAIQIERAVHDSHQPTAYSGQMRTLSYNLKTNQDLTTGLLGGTLTPTMLASMTTEELATKELQKETAEMKARAEKQSIMITEDVPRIRKTHKGEEVIGDESFNLSTDVSSAPVRRPPQDTAEPPKKRVKEEGPERAAQGTASKRSSRDLTVDTQKSPSTGNFDINKVFSSVKSPTQSHHRRPSAMSTSTGPGVDADVDRLLDDGTQSPPYSPKEEILDPDVVWKGNLVMNTIADFQVTAKHIGGAKLKESIGLEWDKLMPKTLTVCGRIDEQQAIVYLCSLRYSLPTDVVVVNLQPTSAASKPQFQRLVDYFVSKKRYGVIGDRGVANVRDTYLVPVLPGTGQYPEFMLNLADNHIPETRTEPMLLAVFVYRNDPDTIMRLHGTNDYNQVVANQSTKVHTSFANTPAPSSPALANLPPGHRPSLSTPAFSPTSPQGTFPNYPTPRHSSTPSQGPPQQQPQPTPPAQHSVSQMQHPAVDQVQKQGEAIAREVLGALITSPTVAFLLPQAHKMSRKEWEVIKKIYERDPKARDDLPYLSNVLERESTNAQAKAAQAQQQSQQHPVHQQHQNQQQMHYQPHHQQHHPQHQVQQQQQQHLPQHHAHFQPQPQHQQQHQAHHSPHHQPQQQAHHQPHPPPPQHHQQQQQQQQQQHPPKHQAQHPPQHTPQYQPQHQSPAQQPQAAYPPQPASHHPQPPQHQQHQPPQPQHAQPQQAHPQHHQQHFTPPVRTTPIPPPPIPPVTSGSGGPIKQTPIPPPPIPPQAATAATGPPSA